MRPNAFLIHGDARHLPLRDESVQCVVTSPPYWSLRDYGLEPLVWGGEAGCEHTFEERRWYTEQSAAASGGSAEAFSEAGSANAERLKKARWRSDATCRCGAWRGSLGLEPTPALYIQHLVEIFREVRRVLRKDGTCWVNMGDGYAADTKWGGASGNKNYTSAAGGFNRDRKHTGLKPKDLMGMPWRLAFALQADGWWIRSDVIWSKPNPMPESVTDRPTKAHEFIFLLTKSATYFYDAEAVREESGDFHAPGKNSRKFVDRDPAHLKSKKPDGWATHEGGHGSFHRDGLEAGEESEIRTGRNLRSVWTIATEPFPESHFVTFPSRLVEICVKAGTSERGACAACGAPWERVIERSQLAERDDGGRTHGLAGQRMGKTPPPERGWETDAQTIGWRPTCACGTEERKPCLVLDPFCGSGTVPMVAQDLGRVGIGVDLKASYLEMAKKRTAQGVML